MTAIYGRSWFSLIARSALLVLGALAMLSCGLHAGAPPPVEKAKVVVPDPGQLSSDSSSSAFSPDVTQQVLNPKIPVRKEDNLLQTVNVNLDLDQSEEQILVLKDKDNPDSPIRIEVADFDNVRNEYVLSWEHDTSAVNIRTFDVTAEDIIGDHTLEIICSGTDTSGEQTLDVFRKTHAPTGVNLFYSAIFQTAVRGRIDIDSHDRSQAYKLGQKNGTSFPIVTYTQDPTSEHIGDLVETTYNWKYQTNTYVKTDEEKIPGKQIEDQRLKDLYNQGADAFEQFLDGAWIKASSTDSDSTDASASSTAAAPDAPLQNTILSFDTDKREITFYSGDVMEVYNWDNSYRTLYNGLIISGNNELVQYIKSQISISVTSINKIEVYAPDEWAGTYQKLTPSMQQDLVRRAPQGYQAPKLSGRYAGPTGMTLTFDPPRFTMEDGGAEKSGGFAIFDFGRPIMEMRFLRPDGIVESQKSYAFDYSETKSQKQVVRTVTLTPGTLSIRGFVPNGDNALKYEQVESNDATSH